MHNLVEFEEYVYVEMGSEYRLNDTSDKFKKVPINRNPYLTGELA